MLQNWRIETILALLPTLLQIAIFLFILGLLKFLWPLNRMVGQVMLGVLYVAIFLILEVTFGPAVFQNCPYRSSLSRFGALPLRYVWDHVKSALRPVLFSRERATLPSFQSGDRSVTQQPIDQYEDAAMLSTSWLDADRSILDRRANSRRIKTGVRAMVHLCTTTQLPHLWEATITTIMSAYPKHELVVDGNDDDYCNKVWWPIVGNVMQLNKERITFGPSTLFSTVESRFSSFPLSMQLRWLDFLSSLEVLVCRPHSEDMIKAYLICCTASASSSNGGGRCMLALVAVLRTHHLMLDKSWLDSIADSLSVSASNWMDDSDGGRVSPYS
jgi:hypothetical protein